MLVEFDFDFEFDFDSESYVLYAICARAVADVMCLPSLNNTVSALLCRCAWWTIGALVAMIAMCGFATHARVPCHMGRGHGTGVKTCQSCSRGHAQIPRACREAGRAEQGW